MDIMDASENDAHQVKTGIRTAILDGGVLAVLALAYLADRWPAYSRLALLCAFAAIVVEVFVLWKMAGRAPAAAPDSEADRRF